MGRSPCCAKEGLNRGAWTAMEDKILTDYIKVHGEGKWRNLPKRAGLKRCGKSCRLRWLNYLRPDIKRGNITRDEEDLIIRLHKLLGNRWSLIAGRLPGRTDNEIKNYWNTNIGKKVQGQTSCTSNRKSSNQSKEKPRPTIEQSFGQPPSPNIESWAVRTKASRCTRVFISPGSQNTRLVDPNLVVGPSKVHDQDLLCDRTAGPEPMNEISQFVSLEDHPSDFILDFDMDEKFLSDFLNSDFAPLCDLDNGLKGDTDTSISSPSPDSNQTLLLHDSDLQSMAALLDHGMDWLQDQ